MRILLVSYWFPPVNVIGAVRMGKFAKYLYEAGHEVRVLTAAAPRTSSMGSAPGNELPLEIPRENLLHVAAWNIDELFDPLIRLLKRLRSTDRARPATAAKAEPLPGAMQDPQSTLVKHYYALLRIPDARAGWIRPATAAGRKLASQWQPDVIIGSAPPNSTLVVAARISRRCGIPWVAELRDLWSDNSYYQDPPWRLQLDRQIERRVLSSATGLVTVSPIWADMLRRKYSKPVTCVLNGYVEEDFPTERPRRQAGDVVSIVYTGNIYRGYRDPSPLLRGIELLGTDRRCIALHLYGPDQADASDVIATAASLGVRDRVFLHDRVSYRDSLALQSSADVLLLLQWNHPKDAGNIPAKFFEYIGARRPILFIGYESGNLAEMIRQRQAGLVANDPAIIAKQLRRWIRDRQEGGISPVDPAARQGLSRTEQFQQYERFLYNIIA